MLEHDPTDVDTAHALARLLFDVGELKEAVAAAKLAAETAVPLERADKAVAIYRDLATLCEKADDPAAAEVALGKAVDLLVDQRDRGDRRAGFTPRDADTAAAECLERLGKMQTQQRQFDDAATAFNRRRQTLRRPVR